MRLRHRWLAYRGLGHRRLGHRRLGYGRLRHHERLRRVRAGAARTRRFPGTERVPRGIGFLEFARLAGREPATVLRRDLLAGHGTRDAMVRLLRGAGLRGGTSLVRGPGLLREAGLA